MKHFVLQKTKFIVANSWLGLLLPGGIHQLLNFPGRETGMSVEKAILPNLHRLHPAESRISRPAAGKIRP